MISEPKMFPFALQILRDDFGGSQFGRQGVTITPKGFIEGYSSGTYTLGTVCGGPPEDYLGLHYKSNRTSFLTGHFCLKTKGVFKFPSCPNDYHTVLSLE